MDAEARRTGQGRAAAKRTLDAPKRFRRINRRSDVRSPSIKLLQQAPHIRNVQKLAGTRHVHRLILFPIEVGAVFTVTMNSAFAASAHSRNRLSGSCRMTPSSV